MASSKIRGITIEIGGETTKLGKALEGVEGQSRDLQKELRGVESLLKMDPKNVDLLKQKQDLLTQSIEATQSKFNNGPSQEWPNRINRNAIQRFTKRNNCDRTKT